MLWIFDPSNVQGRACSRFWIKTDVINKFWKLQITNGQKAFSLSLSLPDIMNLVLSKEIRSTQSPKQCGDQVASHAGVFSGARVSSLPTNAVCGEG